ncbi:MAG: hypothetical protein KIT61_09685 [Pyrinomonadaceae bacterium]|nr:hypothetical protein [Pyrinomonadaceae bacterium]
MRKRKMILGIAVVICLDLAFILSMMSQFQSAELAKVIESPIPVPITIARNTLAAAVPAETETDEIGTEIAETRDPERVFARTERRPKQDVHEQRSGVPSPRTATNKFEPPIFESTIIWIERPTSYEFEARPISEAADQKPVDRPLAAKPMPERKKRNFFAKALPVIKKPYDWIKAFVEKLD